MVASIGLNVNSTAVIIGAMLISPLMGPILGAGFALGMNDFTLLRKSMTNLGIATLVGLIVSFIYFFISPYKEAQSEIIARTSPNIYDVMIAFFGGLVGVIGVTRSEKSTVIPGVAIATALMPPLCTAGFGMANGDWNYFGGAMYLYFINCTFIGLATFGIVKLLGYPIVKQIDEKQEKRVKWIITTLTLVIIFPSIYFAYDLIREQQFKSRVNTFIDDEFEKKGKTIIYKKTDYNVTPHQIDIACLNTQFSNEDIKYLNQKLADYDITNTRLIIRQDSIFLASKMAQTNSDNEVKQKNEQTILDLSNQLKIHSLGDENIFPEVNTLFPKIASISMANQYVYSQNDTSKLMPIVIYQSNTPLHKDELEKFNNWLKIKLKADTLQIIKK